MRRRVVGMVLLLTLPACTVDPSAPTAERAAASSAAASAPSAPSRPPAPSASRPPARTAEPQTLRPLPGPARFGEATAVSAVAHLAGRIGPRHATSEAFARAADWTALRLRALGYQVRRQGFAVPGGDSWGVPVRPGRSENLVATQRGFRPDRPHVVVGAHLDTVPQSPGAEDNASGVGVLLAVAEAAAGARTRLPVVFVVFGAEEPRGPTDADHHYGSRHYVAELSPPQRRSTTAMVSLDRVGVGGVLPVCGANPGPDPLEAELLRAARRAGVEAVECPPNRSSDHWSFARAGLPGVRLGSTPYAGYHSAQDVPAVVGRAQLARAGRTVLAWLSGS